MKGLYKLANPADDTKASEWLEVQKLALADNVQSDKKLTEKVLEAQHISVRLPIIRKAIQKTVLKDSKGKVLVSAEKGQTIICDIVRPPALFTSLLMLIKPKTERGKTKVPRSIQRSQLPNLPTKLHLQICRIPPRTHCYHGPHFYDQGGSANEKPPSRQQYPRLPQENQVGLFKRGLFELHGATTDENGRGRRRVCTQTPERSKP
jgi:hypothetical protein